MEERGCVDSKNKKYALYSVIGDGRGNASAGIWVVRVILGVLLVIALAVVPYISIRMAQVSDRTLVVFQPILVRNNSHGQRTTPLGSSIAARSVHNLNILQSASHIREAINGTKHSERMTPKLFSNDTILALHETKVAFSLTEDASNGTKGVNTNFTKEIEDLGDDSENSTESYAEVIKSVNKLLEIHSTDYMENKISPPTPASTSKSTKNMQSKTSDSNIPAQIASSSSKITKNFIGTCSTEGSSAFAEFFSSTKKPLQKIVKSNAIPSVSAKNNLMKHKLAYVAAAASGNHVGGICIWKMNKNITQWSYFFDNIPMEYQGHRDSTDRELRGLLVAVRMWGSKWNDYHIVLKSHSNAIEGSDHTTRTALISKLDELADNSFTYELEWRLRKDDSLVSMAYSLARLYKDFDYWSNKFQEKLEIVIGMPAGNIGLMRIHVPQEEFSVDPVKKKLKRGGFDSTGNVSLN